MTASEKRLWEALRALKLNIRRQSPIGRYIADFVHLASRLVIEVDGSRHDLPEAQLHDAERDAWMRSQGFRILRIKDADAFGRPWDVAALVERHIKALTSGRKGVPGPAEAGPAPPSPPKTPQ